jgi:succinate-semialdehyde dehydrogenase/glutarate-semialdehyde dehydrogenase
MNATPLRLQRTELQRSANFIAGAWTPAASGASFAVTDPATGSTITSVPDSGAADARAAVDAAQAALPAWRKLPAKQRAAIIKRWNDLVLAHQDDLGTLISLEQGKPLAEGKGEVAYAASYIEWFGEAATRMNGEVIPAPVPGRRMFALREPVGVVAAITPWNFPAAMIARKIAPALAAGCTVVCKPAEDTPLTSLALVLLAHEAGVPAGVLNIVTASRERTPEVVDQWLDDSRVRKITFTGSTPVGKHWRAAAPTRSKSSRWSWAAMRPSSFSRMPMWQPPWTASWPPSSATAARPASAPIASLCTARCTRPLPSSSAPVWRPCTWARPATRPRRSAP